jgi:hypothetical protein
VPEPDPRVQSGLGEKPRVWLYADPPNRFNVYFCTLNCIYVYRCVKGGVCARVEGAREKRDSKPEYAIETNDAEAKKLSVDIKDGIHPAF